MVSREIQDQQQNGTTKNRTTIDADWNSNNGVAALVNHINTRLRYATFAGYPITDWETVDMAMRIVLKTGMFREAYATWHAKPPVKRTSYNFSQFIRE